MQLREQFLLFCARHKLVVVSVAQRVDERPKRRCRRPRRRHLAPTPSCANARHGLRGNNVVHLSRVGEGLVTHVIEEGAIGPRCGAKRVAARLLRWMRPREAEQPSAQKHVECDLLHAALPHDLVVRARCGRVRAAQLERDLGEAERQRVDRAASAAVIKIHETAKHQHVDPSVLIGDNLLELLDGFVHAIDGVDEGKLNRLGWDACTGFDFVGKRDGCLG
mmetsp:Transcript_44060/g.115790  ORF Transcript_44060/g.115790 Transcript_44060/m.115790 type:complete len:221 (+) Transcript_44060:2434-3096(+)